MGGAGVTFIRGVILIFLALTASARTSQAQTYPDHPGKIIVPFAAGGPMDIVARFIGQSLEKKMGQPFIVENKGGGGGTRSPGALRAASRRRWSSTRTRTSIPPP